MKKGYFFETIISCYFKTPRSIDFKPVPGYTFKYNDLYFGVTNKYFEPVTGNIKVFRDCWNVTELSTGLSCCCNSSTRAAAVEKLPGIYNAIVKAVKMYHEETSGPAGAVDRNNYIVTGIRNAYYTLPENERPECFRENAAAALPF